MDRYSTTRAEKASEFLQMILPSAENARLPLHLGSAWGSGPPFLSCWREDISLQLQYLSY